MSVYELFDNHDDFDEDLKTQQTPKEEAQVPLAVPPAASHSLELGGDHGDHSVDHGDGGDPDDHDGGEYGDDVDDRVQFLPDLVI